MTPRIDPEVLTPRRCKLCIENNHLDCSHCFKCGGLNHTARYCRSGDHGYPRKTGNSPNSSKFPRKTSFESSFFPVSVRCIYFVIKNISAHRHLIQFIDILREYSNFKLNECRQFLAMFSSLLKSSPISACTYCHTVIIFIIY